MESHIIYIHNVNFIKPLSLVSILILDLTSEFGGAMETPQHGNASTGKYLKNRFSGISVFLGNLSKRENFEGFPNIFEAFPNI